jgi:hypothetical protein
VEETWTSTCEFQSKSVLYVNTVKAWNQISLSWRFLIIYQYCDCVLIIPICDIDMVSKTESNQKKDIRNVFENQVISWNLRQFYKISKFFLFATINHAMRVLNSYVFLYYSKLQKCCPLWQKKTVFFSFLFFFHKQNKNNYSLVSNVFYWIILFFENLVLFEVRFFKESKFEADIIFATCFKN